MSRSRLATVVLISGGGTTLRNLIEKHRGGELPIDIRMVISSSPAAAGLQYAERAGIPIRIIERRDHSPDTYCQTVFAACREVDAELVVMGGFLKHVLIPDDFAGRVINIHPSLIPAHSGKGYYGRRVHESVLAAGDAVSGCTVHFVDNQYDHGPIILQQQVPVLPDDTPETLAARVFTAECEALPEAIRRIGSQKVAQ